MLTENGQSRVLVVDDEPRLNDALGHVLASAGYQVRTAVEGTHALATLTEWCPSLVITDLSMMPMDGIELCRRIRKESTVPIIMVSGDSGERSKVTALDAGADDYVVKPFGCDELIARVRAALRRAPVNETESFDIGEFRIDFHSRRISVCGSEVRLTPKEFDLFVYLARRPNRVIPHARLLAAIWGDQSLDHHEYLRVFVRQLRIKLEAEPSKPRYLVTEPWVGYRLNPGHDRIQHVLRRVLR